MSNYIDYLIKLEILTDDNHIIKQIFDEYVEKIRKAYKEPEFDIIDNFWYITDIEDELESLSSLSINLSSQNIPVLFTET